MTVKKTISYRMLLKYCLTVFAQVLEPEKGKNRLIPIGKKKVPSQKERYFGFVQTVSDKVEDLTGGMGKNSYETATSGTSTVQPARIAAQGLHLASFNCLVQSSHKVSANLR